MAAVRRTMILIIGQNAADDSRIGKILRRSGRRRGAAP
jgi:hypothetical protein